MLNLALVGFVTAALLSAHLCSSQVVRESASDGQSLFQTKAQVSNLRSRSMSALTRDFSFYHSSAELESEVRRLAKPGGCPDAMFTVETLEDHGTKMDFIRVASRNYNTTQTAKRFFIVAGEHSKEVIGPESVLYFLRALCSDGDAHFGEFPATRLASDHYTPYPADWRTKVLRGTEFAVILNANPNSRHDVDKGNYCQRTNPNDVDLNRNWDEHWDSANGNEGPKPFSEGETRLIRDAVVKFRPTLFLSVHSGTLGMYMPWAFTTDDLADGNQAGMLNLIEEVDQRHCQCPYGAAGHEIGYASSGTSVDYVYDALEVPYSFAFEIFGDGVDYEGDPLGNLERLRKRWLDIENRGLYHTSNRRVAKRLSDDSFSDFFGAHPSEFVGLQVTGTDRDHTEVENCFRGWNPVDEETYTRTVRNWAGAYADMAMWLQLQN